MIAYESLAKNGLGRMKFLLQELGAAPYMGKTRAQLLEEEKIDLEQKTIREISFEDNTGRENGGTVVIQITGEDVRMKVMVDTPVGRPEWCPIILLPNERDLIRRYAEALE